MRAFGRALLIASLLTTGVIPACSDTSGSDGVFRSRWIVKTDSIGTGGWQGLPAVRDGRLFVAVGNRIVAMSTVDGKVLWSKVMTTDPSPFAERIVARDGMVFVGDRLGAMAFDAATGVERWRFSPTPAIHRGGIEVDDVAAYVGNREHRVWALSRTTGAVLWNVQLHPEWQYDAIVTGITAKGDTIYVGMDRFLNQFGGLSAAFVAALDRRDGSVIWEYETTSNRNAVPSFPVVVDSLLLVPDDYGAGFFALNRYTGTQKWRVNTTPGGVGDYWAPAVIGRLAYSGDGLGGVTAVDVSTGSKRWYRNVGTLVVGLASCRGQLLVQNFTLRLLAANSGQELGVLTSPPVDRPTSVPIVDGRRVYIVGQTYVQALECV